MDIIIAAFLYLGLVGNDNAITTCEIERNEPILQQTYDSADFKNYYQELSRTTIGNVVVFDIDCNE